MNKHELIKHPFFKAIHPQLVDKLIHEAVVKLGNPKIKLSENADFDYFYKPHVTLAQAYYVACRYLYLKYNVEPDLKPIIDTCSGAINKQLKETGSYDYGWVNQLIGDTIQAFHKTVYDQRKKYQEAYITFGQIKRFINDGRIGLELKYTEKLEMYVLDAVFQWNDKKSEVFATDVCCSELRDIPEALFQIFSNHPTRKENVDNYPQFAMRLNTLNKLHTATFKVYPYTRWNRISPNVVRAILADNEGYVKVIAYNREAENTTYQYVDYFDIKIVDPDLED